MAKAPSKCPKCGRRDTFDMVSGAKKGFSGGKAVAGAVLLGPIGLIGGALGKKKTAYQCKECGFIVEK